MKTKEPLNCRDHVLQRVISLCQSSESLQPGEFREDPQEPGKFKIDPSVKDIWLETDIGYHLPTGHNITQKMIQLIIYEFYTPFGCLLEFQDGLGDSKSIMIYDSQNEMIAMGTVTLVHTMLRVTIKSLNGLRPLTRA